MGITGSSGELMAWIARLEDVDPFHLASPADLIAHAREEGLISEADVEAVQRRLVDLVDRGLLGATDPLAAIDQPVDVAQRAVMMTELHTTPDGRRWAETAVPAVRVGEADSVKDPRRVAVMHGRDAAARDAIFGFLRRVGLDPLEWEDLVKLTASAAPYNGEAVAAAFGEAQAVVVVLTPDDVGSLHPDLRREREREDDRQATGQPRLNVVLEAGMALQSHPKRTILVEIGHTREISDLAGRNAVRLDGTPQKLNSLASRLEQARCPVRRTGEDWLDASEFAGLPALTREPLRVADRLVADGEANVSPSAARRAARHISVELLSIDRTIELALENGHWWNVSVEMLPSAQWNAAKDVLAEEVPEVYDAVAPIYVEADQLNKAAISHAQGGRDRYDASIRQRFGTLRGEVANAKKTLREVASTGRKVSADAALTPDVRAVLLRLAANGTSVSGQANSLLSRPVAESMVGDWTDEAADVLHNISAGLAEGFLRVAKGNGPDALAARIRFLEESSAKGGSGGA